MVSANEHSEFGGTAALEVFRCIQSREALCAEKRCSRRVQLRRKDFLHVQSSDSEFLDIGSDVIVLKSLPFFSGHSQVYQEKYDVRCQSRA